MLQHKFVGNLMNHNSAFQTCFCGRLFTHLGTFSDHQKTCKKSKQKLTNALRKARESIAARGKPPDASGSGSGSSAGLMMNSNDPSACNPTCSSTAEWAQQDEVSDQ